MKAKSGVKAIVRFAFRAVGLLLHGIFRGLGLIVLFLVLLGIAAYFTVTRMFKEEHLKAAIATQIQEVFHRPVQIDGVILATHGVKVRGVKIIDRPGFPGGPFLESDFALVTVKLLPLLERRIELDNVKLVEPRIHLYRGEDGEWNVGDLFAARRSAAPAAGPGLVTLPFSLAAERTLIEDGRLTVDDRRAGRKFQIDRFSLEIDKFDLGLPFTYAVSFDNVSTFADARMRTSWAFDGKISLAGFDWTKASLTAARLKVAVDGRPIRGSFSVKGFPRSDIEADLKFPAFGSQAVRPYLKGAPDFWLPAGRLTLRMMAIDSQRYLFERVRLDAAPLSLSASGTLQGGDKPQFSAEASVAPFPLASAEGFYPPAGPLRLKGTAQGQVSLSGSLDRPIVRRGRVSLRDAQAVLKGQTYKARSLELTASDDFSKVLLAASGGEAAGLGTSISDVAVQASLADKDLKVDRLALKWSDSVIDLRARVRDITAPKEVILSGKVDRVRWEDAQRLVEELLARMPEQSAAGTPWVKAFKYSIPRGFPDTVGHLVIGSVSQKNFECGNLDLLWDIRGVSPTLKKVSGEARISFGPGHINDIPALQKAHKLLNYVFLPYRYMYEREKLARFSLATAYAKSFDFDRIGAQYGLKNGVATTRYFYVDAKDHKVYYDGIADFGNEKVDMMVLTRKESKKSAGLLPYTMSDEAGRPAIGFHVKGDMNDPDVDFRLTKMKANEIENKKQQGIARAAGAFKIEEKLRDL